MNDSPRYLIWSNQHGRWWRPGRRGYTTAIEVAGRYSRAEAEMIVDQSTLGGQLVRHDVDPVDGRPYEYLDEVMVLAPESIDEVPR